MTKNGGGGRQTTGEYSLERVNRRKFFKLAGATAATGVAAKAWGSSSPDGHAHSHGANGANGHAGAKVAAGAHSDAYLFFNSQEARLIEALVDRLIPADENGPGALQAAVPRFMDRQLAGAWGAGERLYRAGPWEPGAPTQGYQLPFTPAELFRTALRALREDVAQRWPGRAFEQLSPAEKDQYIGALEHDRLALGPIPGAVFFESLLSMTVEGYFSDPVHGGNRDMAAWQMIGFPGAFATFYELVDQHGMLYTGPPMSLGDTGHGVIPLHPVSGGHTSSQGS